MCSNEGEKTSKKTVAYGIDSPKGTQLIQKFDSFTRIGFEKMNIQTLHDFL